MSWHAWLLDGVSPESFELQWPASTAMISLLKLNRSCPGKQEMENQTWTQRIHTRTQLPGLRLGFPSVKDIPHQGHLLQAVHARGAEAPGRHGCLQGSLVVPNLYGIKIYPRTLAGQIRADPSQQTQGLLWRIGSNLTTSPKRTCLFPASLRLMASRMFRRIGVNRIFRSSNRNLSVTFRKPPFCTTSGMADTNLVPRFSLWAHSVSSSTLYSCSSGTGQRDVNLACIAHGAFTFYNVLSISLGLRIVVDVFCIVISMCCIVLYICAYVYILCITLFAMHIICIYIYTHALHICIF